MGDEEKGIWEHEHEMVSAWNFYDVWSGVEWSGVGIPLRTIQFTSHYNTLLKCVCTRMMTVTLQ